MAPSTRREAEAAAMLQNFDIVVLKDTTIGPSPKPSTVEESQMVATLKAYHITVLQKTVIGPAPKASGSDFAFCFDIDGVIYKSGALCPGASEAMNYLNDNKIPFIFLTNGGGKPEDIRAADMAKKLGIPVHANQFIQAHTPFKSQLERLAHKDVLVLGGVDNQCREVAEHYGFRRVITTADIKTAYPDIFPFDEIHGDYFAKTARPLVNAENASASIEVSAIFIYSSPRDWGLDLQIILDLLHSEKGKIGIVSPLNGRSDLPNKGYLKDGQPHIFFSNPDLTYATSYPLPRICQGTFKLALEGMWTGLTGRKLVSGQHYTQIGKPTQLQFEYGEQALRQVSGKELRQVYMVGDGPRSDIAGANQYVSPHGSMWSSILVQTGIHQAGTTPEHLPTKEVGNVLDAVRWGLEQEGIQM